MSSRALAAAALLALGGCYNVSYQTQRLGSGEYREQRGDFFLWGLVGEETVRLDELCPGGPARWKSQTKFLDAFLGIITLGIYVPRHVKVECASGQAYEVELDSSGDRIAAVTPTWQANPRSTP